MKIIEPVYVTPSTLTSSSVDENEYPIWDSNAAYHTGDKVIVPSAHKIYEALRDSGTSILVSENLAGSLSIRFGEPGQFLVIYKDEQQFGSSRMKVGNIIDETITLGKEYLFSFDKTMGESIVYDYAQKVFVVAWSTSSGTPISSVSIVKITNDVPTIIKNIIHTSYEYTPTFGLYCSLSKVCLYAANSGLFAVKYDLTTNNIIVGEKAEITNATASDIAYCPGKIIVTYENMEDSYKTYAMALTIGGTTNVVITYSTGSATLLASDSLSFTKIIFDTASDKFLFIYQYVAAPSIAYKAVALSFNGSSFFIYTPTVCPSKMNGELWTDVIYMSFSNKHVAFFGNYGDDYGKCIAFQISGNTVIVGSVWSFWNGDTDASAGVAYDSTSDRFIMAFQIDDPAIPCDWGGPTGYAHLLVGKVIGTNVSFATSATPPGTPTISDGWLDTGYTNRFKMFDSLLTTKTSSTSPIIVTVVPNTTINALSFFKVIALSIRVQITYQSSIVFDQTYDMDGTIVSSSWEWFFAKSIYKETLVISDLPPYYNPTITFTITNSETVDVGSFMLGSVSTYGKTQYGTGFGVRSYSTVIEDTFGNSTFIQRGNAKLLNVELLLKDYEIEGFNQLMERNINIPCIYQASDDDDYQFLNTYGYFPNFDAVIPNYDSATSTIQIRGLL